MLLGRPERHSLTCSAIVTSTAIEPQAVCGAATFVLHRPRDMAVRTRPWVPTAPALEKRKQKEENLLLGVVCLLTTGDLIRVGTAT